LPNDLLAEKFYTLVASLRESHKIFYYVHFIEYAIFNKIKKVSFYFWRWQAMENCV